jgi:hypothetical protein
MEVALATCKVLPEPDPDAEPLLEALREAGIDAGTAAWDDPEFDWSKPALTLLRSTWNYPRHPEAFLAWAERVARVSSLWNPIDVVRWNLHKGYLLDLERRGVPVVPTLVVRRGEATPLSSILDERAWSDVVVKPAVSAASYRTERFSRRDVAAGEAHLRSLASERDVLVQPYLPSVEGYGERSLVWVEGALTHAVRKTPRFSGQHEAVWGSAFPIAPAEAALAERAVASVTGRLLYARIDVAPGPSGSPVVMELELIEPSLFFGQGPAALERYVGGVKARLGRGGSGGPPRGAPGGGSAPRGRTRLGGPSCRAQGGDEGLQQEPDVEWQLEHGIGLRELAEHALHVASPVEPVIRDQHHPRRLERLPVPEARLDRARHAVAVPVAQGRGEDDRPGPGCGRQEHRVVGASGRADLAARALEGLLDPPPDAGVARCDENAPLSHRSLSIL